MLKSKQIIIIITLIVGIFILGCVEKQTQNNTTNNINEIVDLPNQKQDNNIIKPSNIMCTLKEINIHKVQADITFDNSIHKKHRDNNIRGYKYVWNIYGEEMNGFINIEDKNEPYTGVTIVFDKQNSDLEITVKVRTDYYEYFGEYVEVKCK